MAVWKTLSVATLLALSSYALPDGLWPKLPVPPPASVETFTTDVNGQALPPLDTVYTFNQLVDHTNTRSGTFKQRYWHTWEYYKPGGPIIIFMPGESNADGYYSFLTNQMIPGMIAQQEHGATIVLEHRFFGLSNPKPDLTVASLKLHTIQQAIDDLEYFTKNVKLAMPGGDKVKPGQAPWILIGGSYSGALVSWTMVNKPGLFAAGYASSAVVQAISDFWRFWEPVRENMPKNCSADVQAATAFIDQVLGSGNTQNISSLKTSFGLSVLSHHDDFVNAIRYPLITWQGLAPSTGPGGDFYKFCDALELKNGVSAPEGGWGADQAVKNWATYYSKTYLPNTCDSPSCFDTYNPKSDVYTYTGIDYANRSWMWFVCNELGFFRESAPAGSPSLMSRLLKPAFDERQCQYFFPAAFATAPKVNVDKTNTKYKGWNVSVDHIFFASGRRDPWRESTISASILNVPSTSKQRIMLNNGFHCSDLYSWEADYDPTIKATHVQALADMKMWLAEYRQKNGITLSTRDDEVGGGRSPKR
ncbi:peptidase S28 [Cristinia sonorae]|uniref:Peptidase S28 n=1 Tax=Cristinia sonorae TaxID=1940300 RepID=A0A8K0UKR9_9AGAR|nr:peptidase S28 [Cristinia sonorae]